jgi:hypothetical protein
VRSSSDVGLWCRSIGVQSNEVHGNGITWLLGGKLPLEQAMTVTASGRGGESLGINTVVTSRSVDAHCE